MKKILKKKITIISVICSMIFAMVVFPVGAAHLKVTFDPNGGEINGSVQVFTTETQDISGKEYIKLDDLDKAYGAKRQGYMLCFKGYKDQNGVTYSREDLLGLEIKEQMTFTAQWAKPIIVRLLGIDPKDASSVYSLEHEPGYGITKGNIYDSAMKYSPDVSNYLSGYKLVRVEYGNNSKVYHYGEALNSDTDLQLIWEKIDTSGGGGDSSGGGGSSSGGGGGSSGGGGGSSGGGGGSSGGGGGVSNPKTGDLGIAPYVGILTISVLGTASVVKLLKKEK